MKIIRVKPKTKLVERKFWWRNLKLDLDEERIRERKRKNWIRQAAKTRLCIISREEYCHWGRNYLFTDGQLAFIGSDIWHFSVDEIGFTIDLVWWMQDFQKNIGGHSVCARGHPCDHIGHPLWSHRSPSVITPSTLCDHTLHLLWSHPPPLEIILVTRSDHWNNLSDTE